MADADGQVHSLSSAHLPLWQRYGLLAWDAESYTAQPMWTVEDDDF